MRQHASGVDEVGEGRPGVERRGRVEHERERRHGDEVDRPGERDLARVGRHVGGQAAVRRGAPGW